MKKLTAEEVINFYKNSNMQKKKLIGYKIIKTYPSSVPLNTILYVKESFNKNCDFPYIDSTLTKTTNSITVGDLKDTQYFEPVYEVPKPSFKSHMLESGFTVTIHKTGEVVTNDGTFTIKELDTKFGNSLKSTKFNKWDMSVTEAKYKIGCQVVTHTDIIGINELYKELNK